MEDIEKRKNRIEAILELEKEIDDQTKKDEIAELVSKFGIKMKTDLKITEKEKIVWSCSENNRAFFNYKKGLFFKKILNYEKQEN